MATQPGSITSTESPHEIREAPVSPEDAARFLMMHPKTVLRKAREGSLPAHPIGRDRKRWHSYLLLSFGARPLASFSGNLRQPPASPTPRRLPWLSERGICTEVLISTNA